MRRQVSSISAKFDMRRQVSSISVKFEMIGQVSSIWTNWRWHDKLVVFQL
jgi:hypothetical protein